MKKVYLFLLFCFATSLAYAETISLSDIEYRNIRLIDNTIRAKYNQFKGFNGSKSKMEVIGLPASAAREEINKIDFLKVESDLVKEQEEIFLVKSKMIDLAIAECEKTKTITQKYEVKEKILSEGF